MGEFYDSEQNDGEKFEDARPMVVNIVGFGKIVAFFSPLSRLMRVHCTRATMSMNQNNIAKGPGEATLHFFPIGKYHVDAVLGKVISVNAGGIYIFFLFIYLFI